MTKNPAARRVHRAAHEDDKFVSGVLESSIWARQHGKILTIAGVVGLLALLTFLYIRNWRTAVQEKAAAEMSQVRTTVQSGNVQLAQQDLERFVTKYGKTPAGAEAKLMLGQILLQANNPQRAATVLAPLANDVDTPLGFNAALMLAAAQEANKQPDQAERTYLRVADNAVFDFQKREALDRAARLRLDRGNPAGAAQLYERILTTFDEKDPQDAVERAVYQMRLAEIKSAA
jgi:predicted negative regulator of RcsB-dependent stress response